MSNAPDPVRVAVIGDLHVTDLHPHPYRELFGEIGEQADVLVLAGDLTNYGKTTEAEILAADIETSRIPVVGVLGNHDYECGQPDTVASILRQAGAHMLDGHGVEIGPVGFAGVMGCMGGFGRNMLTSFGEATIKRFVQECADEAMKLENGLRMLRTERVMAVLHYSPVVDTCVGEPPEIFAFLGSSRLEESINRFDNVRVAVHGHAHRGRFKGCTGSGIPVYNCAQMVVREACGRPYATIEL
jgi:Icc-related predicted phosphoesterase